MADPQNAPQRFSDFGPGLCSCDCKVNHPGRTRCKHKADTIVTADEWPVCEPCKEQLTDD